MLGTIGSFLLAPGGWDASCAGQSPQWSRRRASCTAANSVFEELSAAGFHLPEAGLGPGVHTHEGRHATTPFSRCLGQIAFTRLVSLLQACLLAWFGTTVWACMRAVWCSCLTSGSWYLISWRGIHRLGARRLLPTRKTRLRLVCCGPGRRLITCPAVRSLYHRGRCGSVWLPGEATAQGSGWSRCVSSGIW